MEMSDQRNRLEQPPDDKFFPDDQKSQNDAPDDEIEGSAVPESGQQPDKHQIADDCSAPSAAAAQGDIHIIAEPASQRRVPAPVEIRDPARSIGMDKVLYKAEAQHQADAARHQGISPEIKIKFERITDRAQPGKRCGNTLESNLDYLIP